MSLEQLQRFCSPSEAGRPSLATPYAIEWQGSTWTLGTDGTRMLLMRGAFAPARDDAPDPVNVIGPILEAAARWPVDLAALAAFCGAPPEAKVCTACTSGRIRCRECGGTGEVEHECSCGHEHTADCDACRGNGDVPCASCQGWRAPFVGARRALIGESEFDRALVAASLVDAERTSGFATFVSCGVEKMSAIVGDDWVIVVMPVRPDSAFPAHSLPSFTFTAAVGGGVV